MALDIKYKYWAFISYSYRDKSWVRKFHSKLENYKIPRRLIGNRTSQGKIPATLFPVFYYEEDLSASPDLRKKIPEILEKSRNLIVVCSPNSAKSQWVNEEILRFKALGREDRIFPIIIDGVPNASEKHVKDDVKKECFPRALRYKVDNSGFLSDERIDPGASDIRNGEKLAIGKLVSGIISVDFDELWRPIHMRVIRKAVISLVLILAAVLVGLKYYDDSRLKTVYYKDVVYQYGIPIGLDKIEDNWGREYTYKFFFRKGKVDSIYRINPAGFFNQDESGISRWLITYKGKDQNRISDIKCYNNYKLKYNKKYNYPIDGSIKIEHDNAMSKSVLLGPQLFRSFNKRLRSGVSQHNVIVDSMGFPVKTIYQNHSDQNTPDEDNYYGESTFYNSEGYILSRCNLDSNLSPVKFRGIAPILHYETCVGNNKKRLSYRDLKTRNLLPPDITPEGFSMKEYEYDKFGNITTIKYFDQDTNNTLYRDSIIGAEYSQCRYTYNEKGYRTKEEYYNRNGKKELLDYYHQPLKYVGWRMKYNNKGRTIKKIAIDAEGKSVLWEHGYSGWVVKYPDDEEVNYHFIDTLDNRTESSFGYYIDEYIYDSLGFLVEHSFKDREDTLINSIYGYAKAKYEYDSLNNISRISFFSDKGDSVENRDGCFEYLAHTYDSFGNVDSILCINLRGKTVRNAQKSPIGIKKNQEKPWNNIELGSLSEETRSKIERILMEKLKQRKSKQMNDAKSHIHKGGNNIEDEEGIFSDFRFNIPKLKTNLFDFPDLPKK